MVPTGSQAGSLPVGETAITGQPANTVYGPVQVQLVVRDKKIIKVSILEQPEGTIHDIQIGQFAFRQRVDQIGCRRTFAVHAHIQRAVAAE